MSGVMYAVKAKAEDCNATHLCLCGGKNMNAALIDFLDREFEAYCISNNIKFGSKVNIIIAGDGDKVSKNTVMCTFNGGF